MKKREQTQDATSEEATASRRRTPRKPGQEKYHIYLEPDDADGEPDFVTSIPASREVVSFIERSDDCPPATYQIRKTRANGSIITSFTHTKTERAETTVNLDEGAEDEEADIESDLITDPASFARLVAATVRAELEKQERRERAAQPQPSLIELQREQDERLERHLERERKRDEAMQARIDAALARVNPATTASPSEPIKQALELLRDVTGLQSEMGAVATGKPPGVGDRLFGLLEKTVEGLTPYAGPVVSRLIQGAMQPQPGAPPQATTPQQQGGAAHTSPGGAQLPPPPPSSAPPEPDALQKLLIRLCEDCTRDPESELIEQAASYVKEFRKANQQFEPIISQVLSSSSTEILLFIAQTMPPYAYVMKLKHASAWIENLQDELSAEDESDEPQTIAPVGPSRNGDGAAEVGINAS